MNATHRKEKKSLNLPILSYLKMKGRVFFKVKPVIQFRFTKLSLTLFTSCKMLSARFHHLGIIRGSSIIRQQAQSQSSLLLKDQSRHKSAQLSRTSIHHSSPVITSQHHRISRHSTSLLTAINFLETKKTSTTLA